jgi:type IV secretory pathway VirB2 component (pilin)|tara:strand:+ start:15 stop:200 length:186 start_codon:yes stop_codon:yes gene_type:complete
MEFQRKNNNSILGKLRGPLFKIAFILIILIGFIYALGSIDFPAPNKEIEKIVPNENFKIVK